MKTRLFSILASLGLFFSCTTEQCVADYEIVPKPQTTKQLDEKPFQLTSKTAVAYPAGNQLMKRNAEFLTEYLNQATGQNFKVVEQANEDMKNAVLLNLDPTMDAKEGYTIQVSSDRIVISGGTEAGVFYGIQTLRKAMPAVCTAKKIQFPAATITDSPRFAYRGMHLDVARHFFPVSSVKRYIDILALHNMNTFHWHLTEDQGWRIEIKQYPKLTEVGSKRKRTVIGKNTGKYDETPYGGFYTQDEIKEVIQYAKDRHITVIPEIDLPGHMLAALTAYPEYGCTGGPYEVAETWGVFDDVLCIGNEDAMRFLENVLIEVAELFPAEYVHIGGDESPRVRWKACPKCQQRIKAEKLKADAKYSAEDHLQSYCMSRMEQVLKSKGKRIIGWDEILEGDVDPSATIMSWRGVAGGIEGAKSGHDVIMTPNSHLYFDHYQAKDKENEPFAIGGLSTVEHVYSLEPVPAELTKEEQKHILGVQANVWTEYMKTFDHVEYMLLPRIAALSEVQWTSPELKNYDDFHTRLIRFLSFYDREGYNYAKHITQQN